MGNQTSVRSQAVWEKRVNRLLDELNQRRVGRATTVYAIAMWLGLQIADICIPVLGAPQLTMIVLVVLGLSGLPVVIVLAWMFQVTRRGVMLDINVPRRRAIEPPRQPRVAVDATLLGLALVLTVLTLAQSMG